MLNLPRCSKRNISPNFVELVILLFSQQLIVDQTIEKVSFCAPDRNHDRGFSYICRDGGSRNCTQTISQKFDTLYALVQQLVGGFVMVSLLFENR